MRAAQLLTERGFHADAVSRAYYGVHQAELALLARVGEFPKTHRGAHNVLRQYLRRSDHSTDLAGRVSRLQSRRQECDYSGYEPTSEEASNALREAESAVEQLKSLVDAV